MTDASVLNVGTQCFYRKRDGTVATVVVLKVHHDEQPPYYTIGIDATEREKQTEREKLRPCSQGPWPEAQVTPEVTRQLSVKSVAALDKLARCSPDAHALFRQIDKNGDGAITVRELCEFFVSTDDAFARRLFKAIDIDDDGLIDIDEFRLAHKTATETRESVKTFFSPERRALEPQEIDALFAKIDLDRDGCITKRELTHYLRDTLRCPDPEGHAERLRSFIDRDDDKLIDKKEFLSAYRGLDIAPIRDSPSDWTTDSLIAVMSGMKTSMASSAQPVDLLCTPRLALRGSEPVDGPPLPTSGHNRLAGCFAVDPGLFRPEYDYDFTDFDPNEDGEHWRGGMRYFRPCGWKRFGLDVSAFSTLEKCPTAALKAMLVDEQHLDEAQLPGPGSDKRELVAFARRAGLTDAQHGARWLGCEGDDPQEWCVAYHGTGSIQATGGIAADGLRVGGGGSVDVANGATFGDGIYCSPNVNTAADPMYAQPIEIQGEHGPKYYQIIFQCRVRGPARATHAEAKRDGGFFHVGLQEPTSYAKDYWVVPNESFVRPYAILMRQCDEDGDAL